MARVDILRASLMYQVDLIKTPEIRQLVKDILEKVPASFWEKPSSKNFHHEDERGECGNVIHTIRVTKIARAVCGMTNWHQTNRDIVVGAAVIHDVMKWGLDGQAPKILVQHPKLAAEWVKHNFGEREYAIEMGDVVETHMGKYVPVGETPYNLTLNLRDVLHIADCLEVQDYIKVDI